MQEKNKNSSYLLDVLDNLILSEIESLDEEEDAEYIKLLEEIRDKVEIKEE